MATYDLSLIVLCTSLREFSFRLCRLYSNSRNDNGNAKGQSVEALFKSVGYAVRLDSGS